MEMSAQYECGKALTTLNGVTMTVAERIAFAQALATLAVAEAIDAHGNAVWTTQTSKIGTDEVPE